MKATTQGMVDLAQIVEENDVAFKGKGTVQVRYRKNDFCFRVMLLESGRYVDFDEDIIFSVDKKTWKPLVVRQLLLLAGGH